VRLISFFHFFILSFFPLSQNIFGNFVILHQKQKVTDMAYIEPCCIERQLPGLLKTAGGACFFQTNGDITLQKLMDATVPMVGSRHTLVLTVAELDAGIIRTLEQYLRREWTAAAMILTRTVQTELISQELQPYDFSLSLYTAWLGTDSAVLKSAIDPAIAKLKTKPAIDHSDHPAIARILQRDF